MADGYTLCHTSRGVMQEVADAMSRVADTVAAALAEDLGHDAGGGEPAFPAGCDGTTCFLRLNRYPACPFAPDTFGLVPHTDSDFLTILCQDQVGGLQLMKDSRWVAVKPRSDALIVNIGDLFQVTVSSSAFYPHIRTTCRSFDQAERCTRPSHQMVVLFSVWTHFSPSYSGSLHLDAAGVEQQQVQERGAQSGGQRQGGAPLRRLLPVPVVRLAGRHMRRAVPVQAVHLRGVPEEGAGRCQENRQKDWAPQLSQTVSR
uniref:Fe2OG dioxygenase domain-containing protein n=1 Tax=Aegilops tauschii subsp. strangulata TaxID=200361 RepID=A0A453CHC5_AEGTS